MFRYIGRHRRHDGTTHHMVYWQRYCLWHARCESCGGRSLVPGGDGAEAMSRVKHTGKPKDTTGMMVAHA